MKEKDEFSPKDEEELLSTARDRYQRCIDAESDLIRQAQDDIKFAYVPGEQWDATTKKERGNRPCYEYNKTRQHIRQVTNDQRQNRPAIKTRAVEEGDKDTSDTLQGLIRNIESVSNSDRAYDTAFEMAVAGGKGGWRIVSEYADDTAFEQELKIKEVRNPFSLYLDPGAQEWDRRDGMFGFVTEVISKSEFKVRYGEEEATSWDGEGDWAQHWFFDDKVRVAEYWYKKPYTKTLLLLSDGSTIDKEEAKAVLDELEAAGITVRKEREVKCMKVYQCVMSGAKVLVKPTEWPGKFIPIVVVWGDLVNIEGRDIYSGMVRFARDAAKTYNFNRTMAVESVANSPKAPWLLTPKMLEGFQQYWDAAHSENYPYLPYNPDERVPGGAPVRPQPPAIPQALIALAQLDNDDLKAVMGQFDASLGNQSNETSGRAILARQKEGDNANFNYIDNLGRAIRYTGEILVDLIPKYYDTPRTIRILGEDGTEKYVQLFQEVIDEETGQPVKVNDLSRGRYDVTVTVGPSYNTQRMESAETLLKLSENQLIAPVVSDLIVKNLDLPGSDEAVKRLRAVMLKQGIIEPNEQDMEEQAKKPPAPQNPQEEMAQQAMILELQNKDLQNKKLAKEIDEPVDGGPQENPGLEGAKLQNAQVIAHINAESAERIARMNAEVELQRAAIDRQTKLEIAEINARSSALQTAVSAEQADRKMQLDASRPQG